MLTSSPEKITSGTQGINMAKPKEKFVLTISPINLSKVIVQPVLMLIFETVLIIIVLHEKQLFSIKMKTTLKGAVETNSQTVLNYIFVSRLALNMFKMVVTFYTGKYGQYPCFKDTKRSNVLSLLSPHLTKLMLNRLP